MGKAFLRRFRPLILAGTAAAMVVAGWYGRPDVGPVHPARPVSAQPGFANLPLAFEPNQGQSDPAVRFQSRMAGYSLYLTAGEAVISLRGAERPLRLAWQHANPDPAVAGLEPLPAKHHYLKGRDPAQWHRNLPTYGKVRYHDLYPGVDLVYYGRDRKLEYDLVVAPGADPAPIELAFAGMDSLRIDDEGAVQVHMGQQTLDLSRPIIYQDTERGRQRVDGGYVRLADNRLGLRLGAYDTSRPLIIDPVLTFSTYLGGTGAELARGVAVDPSGNVYVVGQTTSKDISFSNPTGKATSDTDVLLAKFDSSGQLLTVIYMGGGGTDRGFAVAADSSAVYLAGDTTSDHFPTTSGAAQAARRGDIDAFIAKLNSSDLSSVYVTYLGGAKAEEALGIAVDSGGSAYLAGATLSDAATDGFPATAGTFNAGDSGNKCNSQIDGSAIACSDGFVAKYTPTGAVSFITYLGGKREDTTNAIAVDGAGTQLAVTGLSYLPWAQLFSNQFIGAPSDAYVAKLDATNGSFLSGLYIGGQAFDQGQAIAFDSAGNIYVAGISNSTNLPVKNALQAINKGGLDGFVAKLDSSSTPQLQYLTYLGGSPQGQAQLNDGQDQVFGIGVDDSSGSAYVVGETMSPDFREQLPLQSRWFGGGKNGWGDAFITKIGATGTLQWSTYLGGSDDDWASGVAVSGTSIYVAGSSFSPDFPLGANAQQTSNKGAGDAFLFRLDDTSDTANLQVTVSGTPDLVGSGETITYTAKVSNLSSSAANGVLLRATLPAGVSYQSVTPANCTVTGQQLDCSVGTISAGGSATTTITAVNNTAGDITFTAAVVRAFQPDLTPDNNTASVTTKAAVGSSSGGGSCAPLEAAALLAYAFGRRRRHRAPRVA